MAKDPSSPSKLTELLALRVARDDAHEIQKLDDDSSLSAHVEMRVKILHGFLAQRGWRPIEGSWAPVIRRGKTLNAEKNPIEYLAESAIHAGWCAIQSLEKGQHERAAVQALTFGTRFGKAYTMMHHQRFARDGAKVRSLLAAERHEQLVKEVRDIFHRKTTRPTMGQLRGDWERETGRKISESGFKRILKEADFKDW